MIPLERTTEPAKLRAKRPGKIDEARSAIAAGIKPRFTGYGDDGVKDLLFEGQHRKCAYCEKREEQAKYREAEHYRPKSRYWWLTWTWENLLFACIDCNREYKRDQFPLADESARLQPESGPPQNEQPHIIDPYDPAIDPRAEIEFRRERVQGKERWRPHGRTERGQATVRLCGLDRPGLIELYNRHVRDFVRPRVERFLAATHTEDARAIIEAWSMLKRGMLAPGQEFCALSRDAGRTLVPTDLRHRYRLDV